MSAPDEILGFTLPPELAADLARLRLDEPGPLPARRALLIGSGPAPGWQSLWSGEAAVERRSVPPCPVWLHAEGMSRALVPGSLIEGVVGWLAGAAA